LITTIDVEICGHPYTIKGEANEAYVRQLAAYVDEQMRLVGKDLKTVTMSKLAVLAAINIAHQLFECQRMRAEGEADIDRRAASLMESIEEHLQVVRKP